MVLNIAINYGGRDEILHSVRQLCQLVQKGSLTPEQITQESITHYLYTAGQPDPDLIIRPSGEFRTSNFLDADKLLVKPLHIAAYLAVGDAGVNLRGFYICVSQHLGHRFNGYTL